MTSPLPPAVVGADAPSSRSTFRLLVRGLDATNRESDTLRTALLARWDEEGDDLVERLAALDHADPDGARGLESRLAIWFDPIDPGDGHLVAASDPILADLSDELAQRLVAVVRPVDA